MFQTTKQDMAVLFLYRIQCIQLLAWYPTIGYVDHSNIKLHGYWLLGSNSCVTEARNKRKVHSCAEIIDIHLLQIRVDNNRYKQLA